MADGEIDRLVWEGRLPVVFVFEGDRGASLMENPQPCYMLVSRVSFLSLCTEKLRKHFQLDPKQEKSNELWFSYNNQPLRWTVPIGVLFDSLVPSGTLPWHVTVRDKDYPEATLLRCTEISALESFFINRVKEAACLKHGTVQIEGFETPDDKKNLWLGLVQDDFDLYHKFGDKLMECRDGNWFRRIPVRFYRPVDKALEVKQVPAPALTEQDKMPVTLGELLAQHRFEDFKAVIHGLEPPPSTPLQWLCHHLCYPDNFVHITLLPRDPAPGAASSSSAPPAAASSDQSRAEPAAVAGGPSSSSPGRAEATA